MTARARREIFLEAFFLWMTPFVALRCSVETAFLNFPVQRGNRFLELLLNLGRVGALENRSHFFDHRLCPGLVSEVPELPGLALSGPFEGGRMISQILISFWKG